MKTLFAILVCFSLNAFALSEVGETGSCAPLKTIQPDGTEVEKDACQSDSGLVMLDFVSATCSYCIASLPHVAEFTKEMRGHLTIRQIGVDRNEQLLRQFWTKYREHMQSDLALDTSRVIKNAYKVTGVPSYIILDNNKKIIYSHEGTLDPADFDEIRDLVRHQ